MEQTEETKQVVLQLLREDKINAAVAHLVYKSGLSPKNAKELVYLWIDSL